MAYTNSLSRLPQSDLWSTLIAYGLRQRSTVHASGLTDDLSHAPAESEPVRSLTPSQAATAVWETSRRVRPRAAPPPLPAAVAQSCCSSEGRTAAPAEAPRMLPHGGGVRGGVEGVGWCCCSGLPTLHQEVFHSRGESVGVQ